MNKGDTIMKYDEVEERISAGKQTDVEKIKEIVKSLIKYGQTHPDETIDMSDFDNSIKEIINAVG